MIVSELSGPTEILRNVITNSFIHRVVPRGSMVLRSNPSTCPDLTFLLFSEYSSHFHCVTRGLMAVIYSRNPIKLKETLPLRGPRALLGCYGPLAVTNNLLLTSPTDALDFIDLSPHGGW